MDAWFGGQSRDPTNPYAQREELALRSVQGSTSCRRFEIEEVTVDASGTFNNPFDPSDVSLDATITSPSGVHFQIPGFFYQAFSRTLKDGTEALSPTGPSTWKIRFTPTEVGKYELSINFRDQSGQKSKSFEFESTPSDLSGFPKVSSQDAHYFTTSGGQGLFPVGMNSLWGSARGTYDYDDWLAKMSGSGLNLDRILLNSSLATFAIEKPGTREGTGAGQFDLASSWKLDHVLDSARAAGIASILCLDQAGELNIREPGADWDHNPLNRDNGGPLRVWTEFWTNPKSIRIYTNKLRYLVARYSSDPNLFAWELWRNVDQIQEYDPLVVRTWHSKISAELKKLDPYQHLITTGFSNPSGDRDTYLIKGLDFIELNAFSPKLVGLLADQLSRHGEWGKPTLVTEAAADPNSPHDMDDPNGIQVHDALWISLVTGAAGGALPWWWKESIDKSNLCPLMGVAKKFIEGVDFAAEGMRPSDSSLAFNSDREVVPNGDLVFDQGNPSWGTSVYNRPQTINIVGDRVSGPLPARVLHGVKVSPTLHNPLSINIRESFDTKLCVEVDRASLKSGAHLEISVDGTKSVDQVISTSGSNAESGFLGRFLVPLSKGNHQILIENTGDDWLELEYRILGVVPVKTPPANIWTLVGNSTVLMWVQQKGWNWQSVVQEKETFNPIPPSTAVLNDLASGNWDYQVWDTWKGQVIAKSSVLVGLNGKAVIALPSFTSDLAIKMIHRK